MQKGGQIRGRAVFGGGATEPADRNRRQAHPVVSSCCAAVVMAPKPQALLAARHFATRRVDFS
jgi:hypothetical protein